jgi:hypothetical protein
MAKKPMTDAQRRRFDRALKKSQSLIDQGVAFNPKTLSKENREHAASNQRKTGLGTAAAAAIRSGQSGKATARKGKQATFKGKKKR